VVEPLPVRGWAARRAVAGWPGPLIWALAAAVAVTSYVAWPQGGFDWRNDIGPAARRWWPAPWTEGLPLLPWAAVLLSPLGALPDRAATAVVNGASVVALAAAIRALGGREGMVVPLVVSPLGYYMFGNGQTDALILAGLALPRGGDLLVLALKPQVALGVVVPRLRQAGRRWPFYVLPLLIGVAISLIVWPGWPQGLLAYAPVLVPGWWNWSVWPWGLPVGAWLLWRAWRTGDDRLGVAATPLLSPYLTAPSYLGLLAAVAARWPAVIWAAWLLFWAAAGWYAAATFTTPLITAAYSAFVVAAVCAAAVRVSKGRRR
jgi:hypothetical protein